MLNSNDGKISVEEAVDVIGHPVIPWFSAFKN
jgi:hypothetical protein